jgi:hypothetical protein
LLPFSVLGVSVTICEYYSAFVNGDMAHRFKLIVLATPR